MTIITIPKKSLIRFLPSIGFDRCFQASGHSRPSLARIDSSRFLMTYDSKIGNAHRPCACNLDEEFSVNQDSNTIVATDSVHTRTARALHGGKIVDFSEPLAFPFSVNGTDLALDVTLSKCVAVFTVLEFPWKFDCGIAIESDVPPGVFSGFCPCGGGWIGFHAVKVEAGFDVFMVRMTIDEEIHLNIVETPEFHLQKVDWLGTPARYGNGWAVPFSHGDDGCFIAVTT